MKYLSNIDLNLNQLLNVVAQQLASDPGSPSTGQFWYNTVSNVLRYYNSTNTCTLYDSVSTSTANKGVLRDGSANFAANVITAASLTITGSPSATTDAATVGYVQAVAQGLSPKPSAAAATTTTLPAYTYNNGTSGVGATLTGNANNSLTAVDGYTFAVNDYLLIKNETGSNAKYNGLYKVTQLADASHPYIFTRAVEMDAATEFVGSFVFSEQGTANASCGWVCSTTGAITVGTTNINFTQFSGAGSYTATAPVVMTGTVVSLSYNARLVNNSGSLDLASGIVSAGTYTSVTVDTYGRVTAGADIVSGNGLVTKTTSGTFTARTATGTTSRIAVTNGDGVSGNPTFDIHASYVGQSSITTLGTIGTGVWQGTTVAIGYGGTGLATTPTDGQLLIGKTSTNAYVLATLTGTANRVTVSNGSGTITLSGPQDLASGSSPTFAAMTLTAGYTVTGISSVTPTATVASATSAKWDGWSIPATTLTITGTTAITTSTGVNLATLYAPTITDSSAVTITNAATLTITGAPGVSGSAVITNAYSFWVQAGMVYLQGGLQVGSSAQFVISAAGIVTSGTWQGTAVAVAYGGTGSGTAAGARTNLSAAGLYTGTITGDGSTTAFTVTHNLANRQAVIIIRDSSYNQVMIDNTGATTNTITVTFSVAPANASTWYVTVVG